MRTNAMIRIVLFTLGILVLSGILLTGIGVKLFSVDGITREDTQVTQDLSSDTCIADPARIKNIEIEWAAGHITIEPSDDTDHIQIMESQGDEKNRMVCRESGSTLTIQFCESSRNMVSFGTDIVAKDLVILVPAGWDCQTLKLEVAAADVNIVNMTINKLDFDGASGKCNLEGCNVSDLEVDAASGDVVFSGVLGALDFDGASADCTLILTECPSRIDLDGMSGNLDITLPSNCGFTVSHDGLSSNFSTDFETSSRDGVHYHGDGHCRIEVDAMSGSVTIHDGGFSCSGEHGSGSHHSNHH